MRVHGHVARLDAAGMLLEEHHADAAFGTVHVALPAPVDQLQPVQAGIQVDRKNHVVCVPGQVLAASGATDTAQHCFAYTAQTAKESSQNRSQLEAAADNAAFMTSVGQDLDRDKIVSNANIDNGTLTFNAADLFDADTANLSANGRNIAAKVAASLAGKLPCYADGAPRNACEATGRMSVVNVVASASFNAFTPEGRARQALALERSVVFHDALIQAQPVLGQLKNGPNGPALLQVVSVGQSVENGDNSQTLSIQFHMDQ